MAGDEIRLRAAVDVSEQVSEDPEPGCTPADPVLEKKKKKGESILDVIIDSIYENFAPALIVFVIGMIVFEVYCIGTITIPRLRADSRSIIPMCSLGTLLLLCLVGLYLVAYLKDPGRPYHTIIPYLNDPAYHTTIPDPGRPSKMLRDLPAACEEALSTNWCEICQHPKPPRAHHCRVCRRCVLKMDHHCPWTDNCVGLYNHREFFAFLISVVLFCIFCFLCILPSALAVYGGAEVHVSSRRVYSALSLPIVVGGLVGGLASFHLYLFLTNQTTIEFIAARRSREKGKLVRNVYDCGWRKNLSEALREPREDNYNYGNLDV